MNRLRVTPAAHWQATPLKRVLGPMQAFVQHEAASGIVLLIAAALALLVANSPWAATYYALQHAELSISVGPYALRESALHWINDGLMALFFLLVGLELKREALVGELADRRQAMLPLIAAVGGATVPALIYALLNRGGAGAAGWGIPMATDIAFALGVLALLGSRVPWALKVFLTAIAVIDDLLAVLVIALFYSGRLDLAALGLAGAVLAILGLCNLLGIRSLVVYGTLGLVVWLAFLASGVHATLAGVLVALTVPARHRIDAPVFVGRAHALLAQFEQGQHDDASPMLTDECQQSAVLDLEAACEQVQAPLQKLEHRLHPWVAFGIVPLFAFANAGVALAPSTLASGLPIALGILLGLLIGKPLGLLGATWLTVRLGLARLPQGLTWRHIWGVGLLAGQGFTMSLFIAALGLGESELLEAAKLGILAASLVAGTSGFLLLRRLPPAE